MLGFTEKYLRRIAAAASDNDVISILGQLATDLGYRSGYLIEYEDGLRSAALVLDSNSARAGWWDDYVSSGLRNTANPLAAISTKGPVHYFAGSSRDHARDPVLAFSRRIDLADVAIVPISFDNQIAGLVGLCGDKILSADEERALQLVCYSLFSQTRAFRVAGIRVATAPLTPREHEVITLSAQGLTSQEVADRLGMSPRTVNQHLDNVAEKLGTRNRVHTVAEAIRRDLV